MSKHGQLAPPNGFGQAFLHSLLQLAAFLIRVSCTGEFLSNPFFEKYDFDL
jgi:hypothetical protein